MRSRLVSWMLVFLFPLQSACTTHKRIGLAPGEIQAKDRERIAAITTQDGREVRFNPPGGAIRGDKVVGAGSSTTQVTIPLESVQGMRQMGSDGPTVLSLTTKDGKEVLFVPPGGTRQGGYVTGAIYEPLVVPLAEVQRFWLEQSSTSTAKTIGLVVGILAGAFLVVGAIVAATKESCPFVYSWDGERFVFDGEPYGGATTRGLERDDYSVLEHLDAEGGVYRLMVTNEVQETQFTNLMELWVVDHPAGVRVVPDEGGRLHTVEDPLPPAAAREGDRDHGLRHARRRQHPVRGAARPPNRRRLRPVRRVLRAARIRPIAHAAGPPGADTLAPRRAGPARSHPRVPEGPGRPPLRGIANGARRLRRGRPQPRRRRLLARRGRVPAAEPASLGVAARGHERFPNAGEARPHEGRLRQHLRARLTPAPV